jgi:hypothetical protein
LFEGEAAGVALRAAAQRSASHATAERVRDGTDESFTIRLAIARVNTENATSFLGHHISATFELRAGLVQARRPAQRGGAERRALTNSSTARRSRM